MSNGHNTNLSASTGSPNTSNQTLIPRLRPDDSYYIEVGPIGTANPAVSRTLCVPATLRFDQLHTVIQIAFDLRSDPYYQFNISHKWSWPDEDSAVANEHYFDHMQRDIEYFANFVPSTAWKRARTRMADGALIHNSFWGIGRNEAGQPIDYLYVYGANPNAEHGGWVWRITVLRRGRFHNIRSSVHVPKLGFTQRTFCAGGTGHTIAENCKGPDHWERLKVACRAGSRNEHTYRSMDSGWVLRDEDDKLRRWFEKDCINGHSLYPDGLNPDSWDISDVNARLRENRRLPRRLRSRVVRMSRRMVEQFSGERVEEWGGLSWREAWRGA
ncbi:hypothetical protein DIS24_g12206 [Lasiodiplodia hormozganensis]|uniref:Plasmid pRiA4b Orf3-like domain-containing protein n=1 Tax=Lasiodiplodia hormozganensis TaxID=869390 RepID=A0AA39TQY9_9PEZI|nr:hypothetical protein DIS24_g12206 [Lasiodiplodia hormozganensis]